MIEKTDLDLDAAKKREQTPRRQTEIERWAERISYGILGFVHALPEY
jgi:hypothetical protein